MIKYDVQVFFIICTVNIYIEKYEIFGFVGGANCFLIRQKVPRGTKEAGTDFPPPTIPD